MTRLQAETDARLSYSAPAGPSRVDEPLVAPVGGRDELVLFPLVADAHTGLGTGAR